MSTSATAPRVLAPDVLRDRTAVVTGAGSGIGRACALRLVELGAHVIGVGRTEASLRQTATLAAERDRFDVAVCDVRDGAAITAVIDGVGRRRGLDFLVNNAGGQFFAPAHEISDGGWAAVVDLNLTAVFRATRAAYPFLAKSRGAVVSMSLSGVERGGMGMAHAIAARAGVLGLTRTLALEWAEDGIRVNCVGPGTVLTDGLTGESAKPVVDNLVGKATPMRTATLAEEVAELVAFVCSPAGRLITGQLLHVDGGAHLGRGLHMLAGAYE